MHRIGRYLGQGVLYALFALLLGYFSTSPRYRHLEPDQALLRLSFTHPGKIVSDCRRRTAEELAKMPANMREDMDCPRERSPVRVRVELDGAPLYDEAFAPAGLKRDGASAAYRRLPIASGEHRLRVQFNDDARVAGFNFERSQVVNALPGQVVLIDFIEDKGGILIR
jgi:hypothetical protein